jgi:hypothetical protein
MVIVCFEQRSTVGESLRAVAGWAVLVAFQGERSRCTKDQSKICCGPYKDNIKTRAG